MRWIFGTLLVIGAVLAALLAAFAVVGPERVWTALYGEPDLGATDFATLQRPATPNSALVCPAGVCARTQPDRTAPVYPVSTDTLLRTLKEMVAADPDNRIVGAPAPDDLRFVARTPVLRFPDTVSVTVLETAPGAASLAIYSRSQIGRSDLGVNAARIDRLLAALDERLGRAQ